MFTKRKPIVLGETYIFDALNETNLASGTSLVTVIKKEKRHSYSVISVNNGNVFECPDKYLTPFVDPEKAYVVRCQYGETEFNHLDVEYFDKIPMAFIDQLITMTNDICKDDKPADMEEVVKMAKELTLELKNKVEKYAKISEHKLYLSIKHNVFDKASQVIKDNVPDFMIQSSTTSAARKSVDDAPVVHDTDSLVTRRANSGSISNIVSEEFREKFDGVLAGYAQGTYDEDEMVNIASHIITKHYPRNLLFGKSGIIYRNDLADTITSIVAASTENFLFLIGVANSNKAVFAEVIRPGEDEDDIISKIQDFILKMYPAFKEKHACRANTIFSVIQVPKEIPFEEEDYEEEEGDEDND